jgi:hypothetical protein
MYIVYLDNFVNCYDKSQGGGYYKCYKNKLSDEFTDVPLLAKKYIKISAAIDRLGLDYKSLHFSDNKGIIKNFDDFLEEFINVNSGLDYLRDCKINGILEENKPKEFIFKNGRIEKILLSGEIISSYDDIIEFLKIIFDKQQKNKQQIQSNYKSSLGLLGEVTKTYGDDITNEDFFDFY